MARVKARARGYLFVKSAEGTPLESALVEGAHSCHGCEQRSRLRRAHHRRAAAASTAAASAAAAAGARRLAHGEHERP